MDTQYYLEHLTQELNKSEVEVMALAMQSGLQQLWREHQLGRYLRGKIPREQAVQQVGIDWVELAERQHRAAEEDLKWGMGN